MPASGDAGNGGTDGGLTRTPEGGMSRSRAGGIISGPDGRIRWPWRVLLFLSLLFAIAAVLGPIASRLIGAASSDAELIARGLAVAVPAALIASWVMMSFVESIASARAWSTATAGYGTPPPGP